MFGMNGVEIVFNLFVIVGDFSEFMWLIEVC